MAATSRAQMLERSQLVDTRAQISPRESRKVATLVARARIILLVTKARISMMVTKVARTEKVRITTKAASMVAMTMGTMAKAPMAMDAMGMARARTITGSSPGTMEVMTKVVGTAHSMEARVGASMVMALARHGITVATDGMRKAKDGEVAKDGEIPVVGMIKVMTKAEQAAKADGMNKVARAQKQAGWMARVARARRVRLTAMAKMVTSKARSGPMAQTPEVCQRPSAWLLIHRLQLTMARARIIKASPRARVSELRTSIQREHLRKRGVS
mmetsp:Transcript_40220/g.75222  ORF Transcript_40220/g.75222 Transcript_40220/m.75222 type:complete len:272 (+) Transcript_40220:204-1019(+)